MFLDVPTKLLMKSSGEISAWKFCNIGMIKVS